MAVTAGAPHAPTPRVIDQATPMGGLDDTQLFNFPERKGWRGLKAQIVAHRAGMTLPLAAGFEPPDIKKPEYIESVNPMAKVGSGG